MASGILNIQEMAASVYQQVLSLNQNALNLVGLDCLWCRLLPDMNSEDVIVQEYTLHSYECPKQFKIVSNKTDYSQGNFSIDIFGIHQEVPLEISIDITTWESVYGKNTMPQKGDFVYIQLLHRPFEVISSACVYTLSNIVTSFKCQLGEWKHNAARKESEDFTISIDALTDSQDRLFGDTISKEVADATVAVETSYQETTYVDPLKVFDIDSVVTSDVLGSYGHILSTAYYDFSIANKNVYYKASAELLPDTHWIYTCWFSLHDDNPVSVGDLKFIKLDSKEKDWWIFDVKFDIPAQDGQIVTINRGGHIKVNAVVVKPCDGSIKLKIDSSECYKASKKIAGWWQSGIWRIQSAVFYNLFRGYNEGSVALSVDLNGNNLIVTIGDDTKIVNIVRTTPTLHFTDWHYLAVDISHSELRVVLVKNLENKTAQTFQEKKLVDTVLPINIKTLQCDGYSIAEADSAMNMFHIRLYDNEYPLGDTYKEDMYADMTRNASKLILVDSPRPADKMDFVTPIR